MAAGQVQWGLGAAGRLIRAVGCHRRCHCCFHLFRQTAWPILLCFCSMIRWIWISNPAIDLLADVSKTTSICLSTETRSDVMREEAAAKSRALYPHPTNLSRERTRRALRGARPAPFVRCFPNFPSRELIIDELMSVLKSEQITTGIASVGFFRRGATARIRMLHGKGQGLAISLAFAALIASTV